MLRLFEPIKIGNFETKNRFVRSATYCAHSDEYGFIGQPGVEVIRRLAENEVGLIISGFAYVLRNGQIVPDMNGIQDDDHIPCFQKMTKAVHEIDGRIIMQIVHGGANSYTVAKLGGDHMAVSLFENMPNFQKKAREMNEEDIQKIIEAFGKAARRVQEADFDGVQIHGAHGYLVSQFLSPLTNHRKDKWGGSIKNRMRFAIEVTRAIKREVDTDFPVMIKLGSKDFLVDGKGLNIEEVAQIANALEKEGICLIEVSHNFMDKSLKKEIMLGIASREKEAYSLPEAHAIRKTTSIPLSLVGGMRSLSVMENIVRSGASDLISLCRPLIREPNLIKRWKEGDTRPAECISCGGCFNTTGNGGYDIYCRQLKNGEGKKC